MKRLILIAVLLVFGVVTAYGAEKLKFESFVCGQNSAYYSAKIVVTNLSNSVISYPRVFVRFTPEGGTPFVEDALISPFNLPPGAMGKVTVISKDADGRAYDCAIIRVQDTNGASLL